MKKIGELLVGQGKITERDVERALLAQSEMGEMLGQVLVKLGLIAEPDLIAALSSQLGLAVHPSDALPESPIMLDDVAQYFLFNNLVAPVAQTDDTLTLVAAKPQDPYLRKALEMATGKQIELRLLASAEIQRLLDAYTQSGESDENEDVDLDGDGDDEFIEHLRDLASEAPVIRLVNQIIHRALDMGASDIHIEPFEEGVKLRYRVDGVLYQHNEPPPSNLAAAVASRIKLLSRMNIAERRLPQDGRIMTRVKGHELDLRVSTVPTVHGESIVMRVLDRESIRLELTDMGFSPDTLKRYEELLGRPHGVLLITGPTGSGKTTTLYASLASIDSTSLKVVTVEDPVEYQLPGINQIQVHAQIDMSFARALRAILRQDPDIIMIGEMRDSETAQIAVQSALTGHLVLSTLHTNTAAGAITRLEDMGIERYLITSSVNGVMAQRLVRTLCKACRKEIEIPDNELVSSGLKRFAEGQTRFFSAQGCASCMHTGYAGRTSIHEIFIMDDELQHAIMIGSDATTLHTLARKKGMLTLYEDGLRKVVRGLTSLEEVKRVTQDQQGEEPTEPAGAVVTLAGEA